MGNPRHHVRPGQRLQIAAEQINFLNGLMRANGGFGSSRLQSWAAGSSIIVARNDTGADLPRLGIGQINGWLIDPASGATAESQVQEMPAVTIGLPTCETTDPELPSVDTRRIGVAVEPIPEGKCGRIVVSGVTPVMLDRVHPDHYGAKVVDNEVGRLVSCYEYGAPASILWCPAETGVQMALVSLLVPTGPALAFGVSVDIVNKGAVGLCRLYTRGSPLEELPSDPAQYVDYVNKFADVGSGKFIIVGYVNGRWYLVAAEC